MRKGYVKKVEDEHRMQEVFNFNRGEIALRVIRACKELDIEVVVVYSQADCSAPYLEQADRALCIGKGPSTDSYLNRPRIIAAAEVADVQAIHHLRLNIVFADDAFEVVRRAEPALAPLDVDDRAEGTLVGTATTQIDARQRTVRFNRSFAGARNATSRC